LKSEEEKQRYVKAKQTAVAVHFTRCNRI